MVDWKKNNKLQFRNFDQSVDFHDVVKCLIMRKLRRRHPNSEKVPIYSEFAMTDEGIGDIWMRDENHDIYVWEIQKIINQKWIDRITELYEDVNLIIVPLKGLSDSYTKLKKELNKYII